MSYQNVNIALWPWFQWLLRRCIFIKSTNNDMWFLADTCKLSLLQRVHIGSGPHVSCYSTGAGVNRPGRETDQSRLFSTEVKNEWRSISILPYIFMACRGTILPTNNDMQLDLCYTHCPPEWRGNYFRVNASDCSVVILSKTDTGATIIRGLEIVRESQWLSRHSD